jgi:hypothetical protein
VADWSLVETQLETWVNNITGLDTHWEKRPRAMSFTDLGWCQLSLPTVNTVGNDILRREYDSTYPAAGQIRTYQDGARNFTFSVQVRTWRQNVDLQARHYTDLLRGRVDLPEISTALFTAADIAYARILGKTDFDIVQDGREMSVSQIDFRFNGKSVVEDTTSTWIETIEDASFEAPEGTVRSVNDYEVG